MKKTKIIATIGPASNSKDTVRKLIESGVNVFRLNFSHGTKKEKVATVKMVREAEKESGRTIAILQDLQGPKIRVGTLPEESVYLKPGTVATLTILKPKEGEIPVQYKGIVDDVSKGNRILLDDGLLELKVISKRTNKIKAKVIVGGILYSNKGINLPDATLTIPALSEKDREDLKIGLSHDVDYVALSFVKTPKDIDDLRKLITKEKKQTKIIAKIERHEAISNIDEIIQKSDAIMVARGDLGIELSQERVPLLQKEIVKKSMVFGKPVIIATQMLDSMIRNPRSTRAETSDIANAILDGADAVMLSGETAVGKYPLNAVRAMRRVAMGTERWALDKDIFIGRSVRKQVESVSEGIAKSACQLVNNLDARLIINATYSGETTRAVAKFRPHANILTLTHTEKTARELSLVWGVKAFKVEYSSIDQMVKKALEIAYEKKLIRKGQKAIVISGQKVGMEGGTNIIKVIEA